MSLTTKVSFRAWPIPEPSKERHAPVGLLAHGSTHPVLTFPERRRSSGCPFWGRAPHTHRLQLQGQLRNQTAFPLPKRLLLLGARLRERNPRSHALRARRCGRPVGLAALRAVTVTDGKLFLGPKGRKRDGAPELMRGKPSSADALRPALEGEKKEPGAQFLPRLRLGVSGPRLSPGQARVTRNWWSRGGSNP